MLQFQFEERFPGTRIFMDLDSIEAGLDFAEVIRDAVNSCAVLVALIGRQWATVTDENGGRRLDNPDDYDGWRFRRRLSVAYELSPCSSMALPPSSSSIFLSTFRDSHGSMPWN